MAARPIRRLVGWSARHRFATVGLGLSDLRGLDRLVLPAAGGVHSAGRFRAARCSPSNCRRAAASRIRARVTNLLTDRIKQRPDVKSVFVTGGQILGSGAEVRKATLTINLVDKKERKLSQGQITEEIGRDLADFPDIRYWFLRDNGQRGFALVVTGRDSAAINKTAAELTSQAKRVVDKTGQPMLDERRLDGGTRPAGTARHTRRPTSPPNSASRRIRSRKPCASPPSAMSAPTSPSCRSTTGRCRSACRWTRRRAPACRRSRRLKIATASGADGAAVDRRRVSIWRRARRRSIAMTAQRRGDHHRRRSVGGTRRSARHLDARVDEAAAGRRTRTLPRRASRSSSSAMPR